MATENAAPTPEPSGDAVTSDAPASGQRFWLFVVGLVVLAAVSGGGLAFTQYGRLAQAATDGAADAEAAPDDAPVAYGAFTELKGLVVNPAGTSGTRYLAVSIGFEADGPEVLAELERKEIVVRDAVLTRLSQRTAAELSAISRRDALKEELRTSVNEILQEGDIRRLYFTQYVLQ